MTCHSSVPVQEQKKTCKQHLKTILDFSFEMHLDQVCTFSVLLDRMDPYKWVVLKTDICICLSTKWDIICIV